MWTDRSITYNVPTIWLVMVVVLSVLKSLASLKSEIFGFMSASSRMLLAFRSRWTILICES